MVESPQSSTSYPNEIKTTAQVALYDNLGNDVELSLKVDNAIITSKQDNWKNNRIKTKIVRVAIRDALKGSDFEDIVDKILNIAREQSGY